MNKASNFNLDMRKTDLRMCFTCNRVTIRSDLKYISRFPFIYCIPACGKCRNEFKKNKIKRLFVKFVEEERENIMQKIMIGNHELEFDEAFVKLYEYEVCDNFASSAKTRLKTNYQEADIDKIFREHTEQEIKDMIIKTAQMEIDLYQGKL